MSEHIEIAVTSEASGAPWTCCAWDARAGTHLMPYRAGGSVAAAAHSIAYLNGRHIVAANATKPLLHIWPVNSQEQAPGVRFVTPGRCTALDATPDGNYIIAGIAESVYVWQLCSGRLLAVLARHFQTVTSVRCTSDGSHFVSAGQDGMVFVWNLLTVVGGGGSATQRGSGAQPAPLYAFADHALPVTDVHVSRDGMRGHLATVSLDRSVKLYDLASGQQLLSVVFEDALTAVTVDHLDGHVYVGSATGAIYSFGLAAPPRQREHHVVMASAASVAADELPPNRFAGHAAGTRVTALSVSLDGESLLSGGEDGNALVWDIGSRQLVRTMAHKGAVLNAFFALAPAVMFDAEHRLPLISGNLRRMLDGAAGDADEEHVVEVLVGGDGGDGGAADEGDEWAALQADDWLTVLAAPSVLAGTAGLIGARAPKVSVNGAKKSSASGEDADEVEQLRAEIRSLKQINKKLYQCQVQAVLKK